MNRQECEFLIGCLLEDIRRVVRMYDETIDHVSMSISNTASRAFSLKDGEEGQYTLKVDIEKEFEEDDADC